MRASRSLATKAAAGPPVGIAGASHREWIWTSLGVYVGCASQSERRCKSPRFGSLIGVVPAGLGGRHFTDSRPRSIPRKGSPVTGVNRDKRLVGILSLGDIAVMTQEVNIRRRKS